jgi:hypothetical protein
MVYYLTYLSLKHAIMIKMTYATTVHKDANTVYRKMLGLDDMAHYNGWTSAFNPTSTYRGSWEQGAAIQFIGVDAEGKEGGMVSEIATNDPAKFVSIRHLGILKDGEEILEGPEVEGWAGCREEYTFEESNGTTKVTVAVDVNESYIDYFNDHYPKALDLLKQIAEH